MCINSFIRVPEDGILHDESFLSENKNSQGYLSLAVLLVGPAKGGTNRSWSSAGLTAGTVSQRHECTLRGGTQKYGREILLSRKHDSH